ncbi:MAG: two pore domain potassium channel family protein [Deltaproteobacteria bacterium]|nr:two pore domain potassium channel family protein [Deltaproteobacteria bacterium]
MGDELLQLGADPDSGLDGLRALERQIINALTKNSLEAVFGTVGVATALFYWAEAGRNEKVRSIWDAFHYVTTSLSVGYATVFPVTPLGKLIGGLVMTLGPALSSRALDEPRECADEGQSALLAKLDEVISELRRIGNKT